MAFIRPTLTQLHDRISSDITTRITGADALLRRSVLKVLAKVFAGAVHLLYGFLEYQSRQLFASTADGDGLAQIGNEFGVTQKAAVVSTGNAAVTGTNGTVIPAATELVATDGQTYTVDANVTIALGVGTVALTAAIGGLDGNQDASAVLSFVSPILNIGSTATVDADGLADGLDEETVEDWRDRILRRKRLPPHGGTNFDYIAWALEVSGVTRAWAVSLYQGPGTVGVAFVRDDDAGGIIPTEAERDAVYNYLLTHTDPASGEQVGAPVTATPGLFVIELSAKAIDFTIKLDPNTSAVQAAAEAQIASVLKSDGGPGKTVYLSRITEGISNAFNENRNQITLPADDQAAATNEVHTVGTITWQDY